MAGLLGQNTSRGLLGGLLGQMNVGATPEALRRKQEEDARRAALLAPAQAPRPVMGGMESFGQFLLGGTEGVHQTRERRRAEVMRPQQEARLAQLRTAAEAMGPAALIAFDTNPEAFGAQLAEQFAPQVIAAGGVQSVIGNGQRVSAPRDIEFGDALVRTDPLQPAPQTLMQRGPTFAEETGRLNANNPINVAPGGRAVDPRTGAVIAEGAPRILAAGDGVDIVSESGSRIYANPKDAPAADPMAARRAEQARAEMADNLQTGLNGSRQFVEAAGVWTHLMPWQRQARANLEGHLETIKGNISFEKLMEMKANSPNGASGLGALSDREARMLANTVGALDADMSPEQLEQSFATIDRLVAKMRQEQAASPAAAPVISREAAIAEARRRGLIP